mmetsp:Transcript_112888/g.326095  ORF Transcript_112888/g.326095 Transcript_112888/m.326095 type:complete len:207 (-) Transcript_112888:425-1045(-)
MSSAARRTRESQRSVWAWGPPKVGHHERSRPSLRPTCWRPCPGALPAPAPTSVSRWPGSAAAAGYSRRSVCELASCLTSRRRAAAENPSSQKVSTASALCKSSGPSQRCWAHQTAPLERRARTICSPWPKCRRATHKASPGTLPGSSSRASLSASSRKLLCKRAPWRCQSHPSSSSRIWTGKSCPISGLGATRASHEYTSAQGGPE